MLTTLLLQLQVLHQREGKVQKGRRGEKGGREERGRERKSEQRGGSECSFAVPSPEIRSWLHYCWLLLLLTLTNSFCNI